MLPPKTIITERLKLRVPTLDDADFFFQLDQDPEAIKYLTFKAPKSKDETFQFLKSVIREWEENKNASYVITIKESGEILGMINVRPDGHMASFGYLIGKKYWNNGFTTEALSNLVKWALDQEQIFRAWTCCDCENKASARVMEKSGMALEGIAKRYGLFPNISEIPRDEYIYAKSK